MPKLTLLSALIRPERLSLVTRMKNACAADNPGVRSMPTVKSKSSSVAKSSLAEASTLMPRAPASSPRLIGNDAVFAPSKSKFRSNS